ncbi:MAG: hypothetical protein WCR42_11270 [bacterium]
MQTVEFETFISQNCINIPLNFSQLNNRKAKVFLQFPDLIENGNFNKITLINAFEKAKKGKVFENIESSILWQQEIRNEWE